MWTSKWNTLSNTDGQTKWSSVGCFLFEHKPRHHWGPITHTHHQNSNSIQFNAASLSPTSTHLLATLFISAPPSLVSALSFGSIISPPSPGRLANGWWWKALYIRWSLSAQQSQGLLVDHQWQGFSSYPFLCFCFWDFFFLLCLQEFDSLKLFVLLCSWNLTCILDRPIIFHCWINMFIHGCKLLHGELCRWCCIGLANEGF